MSHNKKVIAVIPAFNEEKTVGKVVQYVLKNVDEVIVVDDKSSDRTGEEAKRAGAFIIRHEVNGGYDKSLSDGFKVAYERGADVIVSVDADGQHREEDLIRVIDVVLSGRADMGIGQRQQIVHFGEKIFAFFIRSYGFRDPLCGLKSYSKEVYKSVGHFDTVSSIGTELMLTALKLGFTAKFVDVTVRERIDTSRFYKDLFRANWKILRAMVLVLWKISVIKPYGKKKY